MCRGHGFVVALWTLSCATARQDSTCVTDDALNALPIEWEEDPLMDGGGGLPIESEEDFLTDGGRGSSLLQAKVLRRPQAPLDSSDFEPSRSAESVGRPPGAAPAQDGKEEQKKAGQEKVAAQTGAPSATLDPSSSALHGAGAAPALLQVMSEQHSSKDNGRWEPWWEGLLDLLSQQTPKVNTGLRNTTPSPWVCLAAVCILGLLARAAMQLQNKEGRNDLGPCDGERESGKEEPQADTMCPDFVVPAGSERNLAAPWLVKPPGQAVGLFAVTDEGGNVSVNIALEASKTAEDSGQVVAERVRLECPTSRKTFASCEVLVPHLPGTDLGPRCSIRRSTGELFAWLRPAAGRPQEQAAPSHVLSPVATGRQQLFIHSSGEFDFNIRDAQSTILAAASKRGKGLGECQKVRISGEADVGLILLCLTAVDRLHAHAAPSGTPHRLMNPFAFPDSESESDQEKVP